MTDTEQRAAAKAFAEHWKGRGYEKGESQSFWIELLQTVYGVENATHFITFEEQVHLDHTSFIDGMIPSTKVMIEQKGIGKDLNKPISYVQNKRTRDERTFTLRSLNPVIEPVPTTEQPAETDSPDP